MIQHALDKIAVKEVAYSSRKFKIMPAALTCLILLRGLWWRRQKIEKIAYNTTIAVIAVTSPDNFSSADWYKSAIFGKSGDTKRLPSLRRLNVSNCRSAALVKRTRSPEASTVYQLRTNDRPLDALQCTVIHAMGTRYSKNRERLRARTSDCLRNTFHNRQTVSERNDKYVQNRHARAIFGVNGGDWTY